MPTYMSPGVYFEDLSPDHLGLLPTVDRPIARAAEPVRPVRSRWKDARSTAVLIGFAKRGPYDEPVLVRNWNEFEYEFGGPMEDIYLPRAVAGYFQNGGTGCFVVRSGGTDTAAPTVRAQVAIPNEDGSLQALAVTAQYGGPVTNRIEVEITDSATSPERKSLFSLSVRVDGELRERFEDLGTGGPRNAAEIVNRLSREIAISTTYEPPRRGAFRLSGWEPSADDGFDSASAEASAALSRSIATLPGLIDQADIVCVPDLMSLLVRGLADERQLLALQLELIAACESVRSITAVLDTPPGLTPQQVRNWRVDVTGFDTYCAAIYYPWIAVHDPVTNRVTDVPPSGHVAGMIARLAATTGLHRAPAYEALAGVLRVEQTLSRLEIDGLHPIGINTIATVAGEGAQVMSARTASSDPAQRQLARKRVVDFVSANIQYRMGWVLHEPSEPDLWEQIAAELDNLLSLLSRAGVLGGATAANAYVVRCDARTNPAELRSYGQVIAEVVANLADGSQFASRVVFFSG